MEQFSADEPTPVLSLFRRFLLPWSALSVLLLAGTVWSYGYHDAMSYGNAVTALSARSAGLAGTRVFGTDGPAALFLNPAALDNIKGTCVTAATSSVSWVETVVDTTSRFTRSGSEIGALTGAGGIRLRDDIVVAGGVGMVSDHRYYGLHFLPEDPSQPGIDRVEILQATGGLWEALGGASWRFSSGASAGISAGLRFGGVDYEYSYDDYSFPGIDSLATWRWEMAEPCIHAGITVADSIMGAGASFTSGSDHYHSILTFAGRARAPHINDVTMGFEGEIVDPFGENYFTGKISLETPLRSNMDLLAGVGFFEGYNMERVGLVFSVGGSFRLGHFTVDGALLHNARSRTSTSFPEEYSDYVNDTWTQFCFGLSYLP